MSLCVCVCVGGWATRDVSLRSQILQERDSRVYYNIKFIQPNETNSSPTARASSPSHASYEYRTRLELLSFQKNVFNSSYDTTLRNTHKRNPSDRPLFLSLSLPKTLSLSLRYVRTSWTSHVPPHQQSTIYSDFLQPEPVGFARAALEGAAVLARGQLRGAERR
jgi:hypothetical protein